VTDDIAYKLAKLAMIILVINLFVLGYSIYSAHEARKDLVISQRGGCERGKLDRNSNAEGWRIASEARRRDGQYHVAQKYADIALGQENRGMISCENVFPKARLIP